MPPVMPPSAILIKFVDMQKDDLVDFFRQLAEISVDDAQCIRERFTRHSFANKQYLVAPGEICQQVYFVTQGCVRCCIQNADGEDITCFFAHEGQFVSNYQSFLTGLPSQYALQCLEPTELLAIDRLGLEEIYLRTTHGERIGRRIAEHLFIDTMARLTSFYLDTPEQRYTSFLAEYPRLANRIPQHYIAAYIGVRPQSLSRIKRRAMALVAH